MEHAHLSFLHLFVTFLGLIPFFFLWRILAAKLAEHPIGQAMGFIF
jgi:hypothetical protein